MPDMWVDVDTAITVPVNVLALTDDTDFKSRETAIVYNQAGMDLVWNFQTAGGVTTQTAVTPTTGGVYDWTHSGDAMYKIEIPASGGASINNDTEGTGWFTGFATGVLPWRGPFIGFRAAGLNDALQDSAYSTTRGLAGTALPNAAAESAGGLYTRGSGAGQINQNANGQADTRVVAMANDTVTAAAIADNAIDAAAIAANAITNAKIADDAISAAKIAAAAITAAKFAAGAIDNNAIATDAIGSAEVAASAVTKIQSGLATAADLATVAAYLDTEIAAILADTNELQTDWANGGRLDLLIDAIKAKTDNLPASPAATGDIPTAVQNADALLGRNIAGGSSTGRTVMQALRRLRNKVAVVAGVMTVYQENDSTSDWTAAVTTAAGNPVSEVDPS